MGDVVAAEVAASEAAGAVLAPAVEDGARAGLGMGALAERLRVSERTLRRWLAAEDRRGELMRAAYARGRAARLRAELEELGRAG